MVCCCASLETASPACLSLQHHARVAFSFRAFECTDLQQQPTGTSGSRQEQADGRQAVVLPGGRCGGGCAARQLSPQEKNNEKIATFKALLGGESTACQTWQSTASGCHISKIVEKPLLMVPHVMGSSYQGLGFRVVCKRFVGRQLLLHTARKTFINTRGGKSVASA